MGYRKKTIVNESNQKKDGVKIEGSAATNILFKNTAAPQKAITQQ